MTERKERSPQERETLMFDTREKARAFGERAAERIRQEKYQGVSRVKEIVSEEIAQEIRALGEPMDEVVHHPWDHTYAEHNEVQELVDIAFARDLPAALREARASRHYPRNLDLFHDVLTTEMYGILLQSHLRKQPTGLWLLALLALILIALISFSLITIV